MSLLERFGEALARSRKNDWAADERARLGPTITEQQTRQALADEAADRSETTDRLAAAIRHHAVTATSGPQEMARLMFGHAGIEVPDEWWGRAVERLCQSAFIDAGYRVAAAWTVARLREDGWAVERPEEQP